MFKVSLEKSPSEADLVEMVEDSIPMDYFK